MGREYGELAPERKPHELRFTVIARSVATKQSLESPIWGQRFIFGRTLNSFPNTADKTFPDGGQ